LDQDLAELILTACPQSELWVGYGLTEAGPRVSTLSHHDPHLKQALSAKHFMAANCKLKTLFYGFRVLR
jgi:hypothetical protein